MIGQRLRHFRIVEKIGAGGMGEVYRAHDEQLDRDVAIKVLPVGSFRDATAQARLLREARTASRLNHPHICTIHEVGEADGQAYIAMELVEGRPLSVRLADGALPPDQVLRYALQLADALAHAHERGVVHRDLKSANVIITPEGRAKVLDFGLAKRLSGEDLAEATTLSQDLSQPGTVVGTLAYMPPEQLRGEPAEARSDVWALGVMLYEMAAGARPFQGKTGFELSSAILNQAPSPLPPAVPPELRGVIERCLEKEPGRRYQRGGEVRAVLEAIQSGSAIPAWPARKEALSRRRWLALAAALVVVIAAGVALDVRGLRGRLLGGGAAPRIESLAVLPLTNLSGDPAQEYFADGMTEALIAELSKIGGLKKVVSRTSAMQYKGAKKPLRQIASELGVEGLVQGSALREGNQVRITVQLIHGPSDRHLWAQSFDREMRGILALQSEVARAIAGEVKVRLSPQERALLARARPVNPEAYEAYLKGRVHGRKLTPEDLDTAMQYYQLALEKDPNYALAYSGIAGNWGARAHIGFVTAREGWPKAKVAALKALELDNTLAEAHGSLATVMYLYEWDWSASERGFRRAIELNPNYPGLLYASLLFSMRRPREARARLERCLELDPHNSLFQANFATFLLFSRQYDDGIAQLRKVLSKEPDNVGLHFALWAAYHQKGMYEEALAEAKKYSALMGYTEAAEALARGDAQRGYTGAMRLTAERLAARSKRIYVLPTDIAHVYAYAGENDRALEWLEKAYEAHDSQMVQLNTIPVFDPLRSDPRFQDLLRRMNFPVN